MVDEGADLLDVGGESTRPGHAAVGDGRGDRPGRPGRRRASARRCPTCPISVDTTKPAVAEAALDAGADARQRRLGRRRRRRARPARRRPRRPDRPDAQPRRAALHEPHGRGRRRPRGARSSGPSRPASRGTRSSSIPGSGSARPPTHNLVLLRELGELRVLGRPILLGTSRKSTLGKVLDLPAEERLEATLATTALGIARRRRHRPRPRRPGERPGGPDGRRDRSRGSDRPRPRSPSDGVSA